MFRWHHSTCETISKPKVEISYISLFPLYFSASYENANGE